MVNTVEIRGRLVKDPELKPTKGGSQMICIMRFMYYDSTERRGLIDLVATKNPQLLVERLAKGDGMTVYGELSYSKWKTRPIGRARTQKRLKNSIWVHLIVRDHGGDAKRKDFSAI